MSEFDQHGRLPRPSFDPATAVILAQPPFDQQLPPSLEAMGQPSSTTVDELLTTFEVDHDQHEVISHDGEPITVSVFRRRSDCSPGPGFFFIHGGGMIGGNRFDGVEMVLEQLSLHGGTVVSVEYRLAPAHQGEVAARDCLAALRWVAAQADRLGIQSDRLLVTLAAAPVVGWPPAPPCWCGTRVARPCSA